MKKIFFILFIALALYSNAQLLPIGQNNPTVNQNWSRTGNNGFGSTPNNSNIFGTSLYFNSPIYTETFGIIRTRLNGTLTTPINGVNQNVSGYFGIGPNGYFGTHSPWSMLHLEGPDNSGGGGGTAGWRQWMQTGAFMLENSDAMYIGMQPQGGLTNRSDAIINWSDDATGILGPDRLKIVFTGIAPGNGIGNNPTDYNSLNGYEYMEFAASPLQNNNFGRPVGNVGIGPVFTSIALPQSRLHINSEDDLETWFQITNQTGTGQTANDGFRVGILSNGVVNLRQQENLPMVFYTDFGNVTSGGGADWERMRITHIGAPNVPAPFGIPLNTTRVSINEDGDFPITNPRSLLHLGYNTGTLLNGWTTTDGWRPWMNVGTFICEYTDHIYVGMKNENFGAGDRSDAVIGWGDNHHQDLNYPFGQGPDNLRFIFTGYTGAVGVDPRIVSQDGLEVGRFTPDGNLGIGDFTAAGLNQQPTHRIDVDGNGRIRQMPYTTNVFDAVTIDAAGVLWRGPYAAGFGAYCTSLTPFDLQNDDWRIGLNGHTVYFEGQSVGAFDNVAVGYGCGSSLMAKFNALQIHPLAVNNGIGTISYAGTFFSFPQESTNYSCGVWGYSKGVTVCGVGVAGIADAVPNSTGYNWAFGVYGEATPSTPIPIAGPTNHLWAGAFNGAVLLNSFMYGSDSILKKDINPITNSLSIIDSLKPKSFYYDTTFTNSKGLWEQPAKQYGFVAQDVEKILPELVTEALKPPQYDTLGNEVHPAFTYKALNYNAFIGILTQGVKDLDSITQGISAQVSGLPKISFGAKCDIDSGSFELPSNWRVGLNDKNLYFDGQGGSGGNNIGVGYTCDDALVGKLSVWETTQIGGSSVAGYFNNTAIGNFAASVMGTTDKSNAKDNYAGFFTAQSSHGEVNTGVLAIAKNGKQNYGIWAEAPQNTTDQHASVAAYINGNLDGIGVNLYVSDAKFKNNVQNITNATDIIEQLQPRTFNFNTTGYPYMNFNTGNQYGFVAQEMISVLPDLVKNSIFRAEYDSVGNMIHDTIQYKSLNYEGLIPIVVQAVKEMKSKNDSITDKLNDRIDSLRQVVITNNTMLLQKNDSLRNVLNTFNTRLTTIEDRLEECCKGHNGNGNHSLLTNPNTENTTEVELENVQAIVLDQNVPNPFAESTVITYFIPDNINYAQIVFTDNYGRIMKTVDIKTSGAGMIKVYAANLSSGTYTYSLMVDGKVVESKKMMCVK